MSRDDRALRGAARIRACRFGSRHAVHILERNRFIFRRGWMVIVSGFFEPVFFLLGIGFGLGALIGTVAGPDGRPSRTRCSSRRPCWPRRR